MTARSDDAGVEDDSGVRPSGRSAPDGAASASDGGEPGAASSVSAAASPASDGGASASGAVSDAGVAAASGGVRVERGEVLVRARLVPRFGRFMALGAVVGAAGGWAWSRLGSSGSWLGSGPVVDTSGVVPLLVMAGVVVGIVCGAVVAVVLDRVVGRRRRTLTAERTRHLRDDA